MRVPCRALYHTNVSWHSRVANGCLGRHLPITDVVLMSAGDRPARTETSYYTAFDAAFRCRKNSTAAEPRTLISHSAALSETRKRACYHSPGASIAAATSSEPSPRPPVAARTPSALPGAAFIQPWGSPTTTTMKRAGTPQERALAQVKLKAAATASRSAALFQKSVASAKSRPTSKRGKKTEKKKHDYISARSSGRSAGSTCARSRDAFSRNGRSGRRKCRDALLRY